MTKRSQLWREAEESNKKAIAKYLGGKVIGLNLKTNLPVGVTFIADQHICCHNLVDIAKARRDAEIVARTPGMWAVLAGDAIDNHIKHVTAIVAARSQPEEQWKLLDEYLRAFKGKILILLSGNHERWTNQFAGVDALRWLANKCKVAYRPHEARIKLAVGDQSYNIAVRHNYRGSSSLNPCLAVKRWWDMGAMPFDIGVLAHTHQAAVESFSRHGVERWAARVGSYQVSSDWMAQQGFEDARAQCPTFILWPNERQIVGIADLKTAAGTLKAERRSAAARLSKSAKKAVGAKKAKTRRRSK